MRAGALAMLVAGLVLMLPSSAAAEPGPPAHSAGQPATASGAPWCDRTPWKSGTMPASALSKRISKIMRRADQLDTATDIVGLFITGLSLGSAAAPTALVKAVAKVGKAALKRTLKSLGKQAKKVRPRTKDTGVKLKIKCKFGFVPYPSFGIYHPG